MSGLRFAIFGSSLVSSYWNGAATYYRGIVRALASRGHEITFYEPDAFGRQEHRDMDDPAWANVVVYRAERPSVWRSLEEARDADVLIKTSGVGIFDELLEAAVLEIAAPHALTVFWDVDAPATLERVMQNASDPFRPLIPRYSLILAYGGGDRVVNAYLQLGARACVPIYNALDATTHLPASPEARFSADLSLLANRLPDREARIDEFFFRAAALAPECTFLLGGNGWNDKQMPSNVRYIGHVPTMDHNSFNSSARAILNVNRESMKRFGFSPPTRIFEAAGAGACIITDAWEGLELFLEPKREILVAKNGAEVAELLRSLTPSRAKQIGDAARQRIVARHTYDRRVDQLESVLALHRKHMRIFYAAHQNQAEESPLIR